MAILNTPGELRVNRSRESQFYYTLFAETRLSFYETATSRGHTPLDSECFFGSELVCSSALQEVIWLSWQLGETFASGEG